MGDAGGSPRRPSSAGGASVVGGPSDGALLGALPGAGTPAGAKTPDPERWVCPNDRHLALRAKLQMGWSTPATAPVQRADSLSESETKMILDVIKRAEELDLYEQKRIGRLVDRVETLKSNGRGNGSKTCILCGEGLPMLRTSSIICADCNKGVCSKCGVDGISTDGQKVWLCKICAETREMWKRSGAWFFRGIPKHIRPASLNGSDSRGGRRGRGMPRRAQTLAAARGSSCSEIDTDTSSEDETQRRQRMNMRATSESQLDTDLPQALSPRSRSTSPAPRRLDSGESMGGGRDSSDERGSDRSPLSPGITGRGMSRTSSRESSGGGEGRGPGSLFLTPDYSPSPHTPSPRSPGLPRGNAIDRSPSPLLRVAWRDSGRGSNSSASEASRDSRDSRDELESEDVGAGHGSSGSNPNLHIRATAMSPSRFNRSSSSGSGSSVQVSASPTVNGFRSRGDSDMSRSSDERRNPRLGRAAGGSKESRGSRDSRDSMISRDSTWTKDAVSLVSQDDVFTDEKQSMQQQLQKNNSKDTKDNDDKEKEITNSALGSIELSMLYDSHNQALHCTIHKAKNLRMSDNNSIVDPYVKLHLLPGASKSNKLRTKTMTKTLNPEFNETLTYYGLSEHDMARKTLRLQVLDEERFGNDFLGEARVPLKKIKAHETKKLEIFLEKKVSLAEDEVVGEVERGKLLLSLKYATQRSGLIVGIVRAATLRACDSNGFSDPYVKVQLKPDPSHKKHKTAVKWKNLNPEFNEEFFFQLRRNELPKKLLDIRVYDRDVGRHDDFIGGLQLSQDSAGTELRHWYDALQYPDRRHDRWHMLQELNGK